MHDLLLIFALVLNFVSVSDPTHLIVVEDAAGFFATRTYEKQVAYAQQIHVLVAARPALALNKQLQRSTRLGILFASRRCLPR